MLNKKIKAIRLAKNLSPSVFCAQLKFDPALHNLWEHNKKPFPPCELQRFVNHKDYKKYSLWLIKDETVESVGQIAPGLTYLNMVGLPPPKKRNMTISFLSSLLKKWENGIF